MKKILAATLAASLVFASACSSKPEFDTNKTYKEQLADNGVSNVDFMNEFGYATTAYMVCEHREKGMSDAEVRNSLNSGTSQGSWSDEDRGIFVDMSYANVCPEFAEK